MRTLITVFAKEFLENLRDRRTLLSALLFGPLFGPLLFGLMVSRMLEQSVVESDVPLKIVDFRQPARAGTHAVSGRTRRQADQEGIVGGRSARRRAQRRFPSRAAGARGLSHTVRGRSARARAVVRRQRGFANAENCGSGPRHAGHLRQHHRAIAAGNARRESAVDRARGASTRSMSRRPPAARSWCWAS